MRLFLGATVAMLLVVAVVAGVTLAPRPPQPFATEIVVRTVRGLQTAHDVEALVALAARQHVGTINLAVKQDEDDERPSGVVFYSSRLAPRARGYESLDVLAVALAAARRHGIRVRAWVPQFRDQSALGLHPDWQMLAWAGGQPLPYLGRDPQAKEFLIDPLDAAAQAYQRAIVTEIARDYAVDGIVLDWLRFDDYAMPMGQGVRARFEAAFGYDPAGIDFTTDNPRRAQWNAWRSGELGAYVGSVRRAIDRVRPGLELGAYILPPEFVEVGQDAARFVEHLSFLAPMAYFRDWGYASSWVYRNVVPTTRLKAKGVAVIPVLDHDWDDEAYREILPNLRRTAPEISTLAWFNYGAWTEADLVRIDRLRRW